MTSLAPSHSSLPKTRRPDVFYSTQGAELGPWSEVQAIARRDPSSLMQELGLTAPALVFDYGLTSRLIHFNGVCALSLEQPASALELRTALQEHRIDKTPYHILAQNGTTSLAPHVQAHANLGYKGMDYRFLGALEPQGTITVVNGQLGDLKEPTLEIALRTAIGLPVCIFPYQHTIDEHGIPRQLLHRSRQ
jgi:hypothetical protein